MPWLAATTSSLRVLVADRELAAAHPQQRHRPLQHRAQQAVQLQLAREVRERGEQRALLVEPPLLRGEEPRPPDRDARLRGGRLEDLQVAAVEGAAPVAARHQLADGALVDAQRQAQLRGAVGAPVEGARAGAQRRDEVVGAAEVHAGPREGEGLVAQRLHHRAAHRRLVLGLGDAGAEAEQRRAHLGQRGRAGGAEGAGGTRRRHGAVHSAGGTAGRRTVKTEPSPGALVTERVPAHHLAEAPRDRQAQAGAAVAPRRRGLRLLERLEDLGGLLRRHPDAGVADAEQDGPVLALGAQR